MRVFKIKYDYRLHTVKSGETLHSIAKKYDTTAAHIGKLNRIPRAIAAGDMLYIGGLNKTLYIVQPMDTLESIARKFHADAVKIRQFNDINLIYIGQRILI